MNSKILFVLLSIGTGISINQTFAMEPSKRNVYIPPHRRQTVNGSVVSDIQRAPVDCDELSQRSIQDIHGEFIWKASQGDLTERSFDKLFEHPMLDINVNYKKKGKSVLHWLASNALDGEQYRYLQGTLAKILSISEVAVNIQDDEGKTPLQWAAGNGNLLAVKMLLNCNAEVNKADNTGATPLHWAAFNGHTRVAEYLIDQGHAKIYLQDKMGATPLSRAVRNNKLEMVKMLLSKNPYNKNNPSACDKNILLMTDKQGKTALHYVGNKNIAKLLLDAGFPKDIRDNQGFTAHDIAMKKRFFDTAALLKI